MSDGDRSHKFGPALLAALLAAGPVQAQIVTDGSLGPRASLSGPNIEIGADLGARRDGNLFHSFERFGIATGQTATFTGPGDIRNVISRVTGGEISTIDGTLASRVGQADLYFLNPAGVVFGPNARLDLPGSLHVSTAHELRFADGARFSALDRTGSGLTVAPPEAFGFLDRPPGHITVDQSQLEVPAGKTFSLVGGTLAIAGTQSDGNPAGTIKAENGTVNLASVTGAGQFRFADAAVDAARQGAIRVADQALIDVSGDGGGTIRIRGGALGVENSSVFADNTGERDSTTGLDLQAGSIEISNSAVTADVVGSGRGGTAKVKAGQLAIRNGGRISSDTYGPGAAGTVEVSADHVLLSHDGVSDFTGIRSYAAGRRTGSAGMITVTARELALYGSAIISTTTFGRGDAGIIDVRADRILVSSATEGATSMFEGEPHLRNAQIIREGDVTYIITARQPSLISTSTQRGSTGQGGAMTVNAHELELHGGQITSNTWGGGNAGHVIVNADRLLISAFDPVTGDVVAAAIDSATLPGSTGQGGTVTVISHDLELRAGGQINTSTGGSRNGGTVTVRTDRLVISGSMPLPPPLEGPSAIGSTSGGSGTAGTIIIEAQDIVVRDGGVVTTESYGRGGSISISATDTLRLDDAAIRAETTSNDGGDVKLSVGRLFHLQDSTVTTSVTGGKGSGGNILINSPLMVLDSSKTIANAQGGNGGNITIQAGQLIRTPDSIIQASSAESVSGTITITAPNTDVTSSLIVLPETFLDAGSQLRVACAARGGRPASSFTAGGRGGLPPDPDAPLGASPFEPPLKQQAATGSPTASTTRPAQATKTVRVAGTPQPVLGAPRPACRG